MPTAKVQLPDGRIGKFDVPEGTTPEQVMEFAQKEFTKAQAAPATPGREMDAVDRFLDKTGVLPALKSIQGVIQGPTAALVSGVPFSDEVAGLAGGAKGFTSGEGFEAGYNRAVEQDRATSRAYAEENPKKALALQVLGGVGSLGPGGAPAQAPAQSSLLARSLQGAATAIPLGAGYGFAAGEGGLENRLMSGAATGLVSGVIGAAAPVVGEAVNRGVRAVRGTGATRAALKSAPTTSQLKSAANKAFDKADEALAAVKVPEQEFRKAASDIASVVRREGIDPTLHPKATAALKRIVDAADDPQNAPTIATLRRIVATAARSREPDEARIANMMLNKLDDFADEAGYGPALAEARGLWSRFRRSELVENMIDRAKAGRSNFSSSGYENALRREFINLAKNSDKMRFFSDAEKAAIRNVAEGGPIVNALRFIGKLAPRGVISAGFGGAAGLATGNPAVTAGIWAAGETGRRGATALTQRNAEIARAIMAQGGGANVPQITPQTRQLIEALTQRTAAPASVPIARDLYQYK